MSEPDDNDRDQAEEPRPPTAKELEFMERRLIVHEVANSIRSAQLSAHKLRRFLDTLPEVLVRGTQVANWISDIASHLSSVETVMYGWADPTTPTKLEAILLASAWRRARGPRISRTNFRHELNRCMQPLRPAMMRKALTLNVNYLPRGLYVNIDPENLRIILNNLATNAVKYSERGSSIQCGFFEQRYAVRFFMKNLAPALEEGESLRIFDVGFRGLNARKVLPEGTGLGLYVVRRICDFHGIDVSYHSVPTRSDGGPHVWHEFNLDFPLRGMVERGEEW